MDKDKCPTNTPLNDEGNTNQTIDTDTRIPDEMLSFFQHIAGSGGARHFLNIIRGVFLSRKNHETETYYISFVNVNNVPSVSFEVFDTKGTCSEVEFSRGLQTFAEHHLVQRFGTAAVKPNSFDQIKKAIERFQPRETELL